MFGIRYGGEIHKKYGFCNWVSLFCGVLLCIFVVGSFTGCGKVSESSEESGRVEKTEEASKEKKPTIDEAKTDTSQKNEETKDNEPIDDVEIIELQDPLVERCVRATLGKGYDEEITNKDCASVTKLLIDCDLDVGITMSPVQLCSDVSNYIDLCDLQYLTELEELIIDNNVERDILINLEAIESCSKLKSLTMMHRPSDGANGSIQVGYKYLADIVKSLPRLEYLDLGYMIAPELKELISGDNVKLVFDDSVKWSDVDSGVDVFRADNFSQYVSSWTYDYKENGQTERTEILADSRGELEEFINSLPTEIEDIYVSYMGNDVIDMSIFARFKHLKTLTIDNTAIFYTDDYSTKVVKIENIEKLVSNKEMFSLNLCGVAGDLDELKKLTQIKELSIYTSVFDSFDFLLDMKELRELSLLYNITPNTETFFVNHGSELSALRFLRIEDNNTVAYEGIDYIPNLEALIVMDRGGVKNEIRTIAKCKTLKYLEVRMRDEGMISLDRLSNLTSLQFLTIINRGGVESILGVDNILTLPELVSFSLYANVNRNDKYYEDLEHWIELATKNYKISHFTDGMWVSKSAWWSIENGQYSLVYCLGGYEKYYEKLFDAGISCGGFDNLMVLDPERYYDSAQIQAELNR